MVEGEAYSSGVEVERGRAAKVSFELGFLIKSSVYDSSPQVKVEVEVGWTSEVCLVEEEREVLVLETA